MVDKKIVFVDFGLYGRQNRILLYQQEERKRSKHINTHILVMKTFNKIFGLTVLGMACSMGADAQTDITVHQAPASTDTTQTVVAQPVQWTLQACIDYALKQNISIQQNRLSAVSSQIDVASAKADFLPNISASVSQRIVNRPNSSNNTMISGDLITTSTSKTSYNGSYGVDLNWTLFNGSRLNTLKQQQLSAESASLDVAESENTIIENITKMYIQILYSAEAIKINESTLETSRANFERSKQLFEAGSISKADLAQLESQVSQDNYSLVTSQANLQNYKLQLKQLLELGGEEEMNLYLPEVGDDDVLTPLPSRTDVYNAALAMRPEIQAGKIDIDASDVAIKVARAGYLPTLSLSAGIGTSNANGSDFTFREQVKNNWNNSLGLTLSIPIYDKRSTKSQIQKAKIQKRNSELQLQDKQKTLYSNIENLWLDANSAQQQYIAAKEQVKSAQTSFDLVQEQFNLGMKNTVELLTEQNNLLSAQQQQLQAKYMALMNEQLLNFYKGESINIE